MLNASSSKMFDSVLLNADPGTYEGSAAAGVVTNRLIFFFWGGVIISKRAPWIE